MKTIGVVLAAGSATRFEGEVPKQFLEVNGKMILEYALSCFQQHPLIDEIVLVVQESHKPLLLPLKEIRVYDKMQRVITGGKERHLSTWSVIEALKEEKELNILFHDAARPLVNSDIITRVVEALAFHKAVVPAIPVTDTILEVSSEKKLIRVPDRKRLSSAQTPQGFKLSIIRRAFEKGMQEPTFSATDDSGVVSRYLPEIPVHIVDGAVENKKITFKDDIFLFKEIVKDRIRLKK